MKPGYDFDSFGIFRRFHEGSKGLDGLRHSCVVGSDFQCRRPGFCGRRSGSDPGFLCDAAGSDPSLSPAASGGSKEPGFKIRGTKGWSWTPEQYLEEIPVLAAYKMNFMMNCYLSLFSHFPQRRNDWWLPLILGQKAVRRGVPPQPGTRGPVLLRHPSAVVLLAADRSLQPARFREPLEALRLGPEPGRPVVLSAAGRRPHPRDGGKSPDRRRGTRPFRQPPVPEASAAGPGGPIRLLPHLVLGERG